MIPYSKQSLDAEDRAAVAAVLEGDWLTQGPAVSDFEEAVAARCGVPHAVAFSSGTAALHAAAFAAEVGPGDEIVTSAITFAASANCGAYLGARPLFADIEAETWNVSAATLEAAMTPKVKAVIPVHFAGLPAPIEPIRELVGPGVTIIEDAAHALGGHSGEGEVGSCAHTEMAIFSLHPTKAITSAEGGVVTTRDPELAERLAVFRHHGMVRDPERFLHPEGAGDEGPWYHEQQHLGFNYRLSDLHAALGHSQLGKLDAHVAARNAVATRYREGLAGIDGLGLPPQAGEDALHAHHLFVVHLRDGTARRLALYRRLLENEIRTQVHYIPVYRHPYYRSAFGYGPGLCPEAERYYSGCLSLPCYPDLSPAEQDRVIEVVREAMSDA
ncbi:MAG TPA: UDP-4-amino-4,6-dideoxy-N-acetyl-beta-L-altrosamine transaminase [Solirubrobacterales bacterium]|nr:UDP-4-amino-4,6-dideoxy-N-acetyl-beta-L-altrosamine transaminase [Solirubrobacterales bacterium]